MHLARTGAGRDAYRRGLAARQPQGGEHFGDRPVLKGVDKTLFVAALLLAWFVALKWFGLL